MALNHQSAHTAGTAEPRPVRRSRLTWAIIAAQFLIALGSIEIALASMSDSRTIAILRGGFERIRLFESTMRAESTVAEAALVSGLVFVVIAVTVVGGVALDRHVQGLRVLAETDPLTGLLNRAAFMKEAQRLLRRGRNRLPVAIAIVDLDRFKEINDTHGHDVGDQVLHAVTDRLHETVQGRHTVLGRLGGDEFVIATMAERQPPSFHSTWTRLASALRQLIDVEIPSWPATVSLQSSASIGVAHQRIGERKTLTSMMIEADLALYEAKASTDHDWCDFTTEMRLERQRRELRRSELGLAVEQNEFVLHFQPEIDLRSGHLTGAEALLRWQHPKHGVLTADAFIDDLEESGLIDDLLPMIVGEATRFGAAHVDASDGPFMMRINLTAAQILDPRLGGLVAEARSSAPDLDLCLEITERSVLDASGAVVDSLRRLRSMGVSVALDDFGTGYSSLKQLHDLPVDVIKIDRTFVNDLALCRPDESIAAIIIDLGSLMDLDVVAEGIETDVQLDALNSLGCRVGQGYLFGRAMDPEHFRRQYSIAA